MAEAETIEEIEAQLQALPPAERDRALREIVEATKGMKWIPSPGPQLAAYNCKADVLLYGGEPGGGKSQLLLGLAFNCHQRSLIMRRQYTDLNALIEDMLKINGGRNGYNGSPPPSLRFGNKSIELGAANAVGDEQHWMGQAHDLLGLDEATQFAESQVRLLMGWVRSADPKQRTRVVLATNPPLSSDGLWVTQMFAPWLDDRFPNPARAGELRWVVTGDDGDVWVDGPTPVMARIDGVEKIVTPTSRSFIPSSVKDNPFLAKSGYQKTLDALPAEIRSILMGGFKTSFRDAEFQVIPTDWIRQAQARWTPRPRHGVPMCALGVDPSGGGNDPMVIAPRYDGWFAPLIEIPAKSIPKERIGSHTAAMVITNRRDQALVILDMGGGYGGGCYEVLHGNAIEVRTYKGSEKSTRRTKDKQMGFFNVRSEAIWRFREALDPDQDGGSPIALPDDPILVADLTAPRIEPDSKVIKVEPKEDIVKRLGRSTNRGDAVVMAWYDGPKHMTDGGAWEKGLLKRLGRLPNVIMGRSNARR